MAENHFLTDGSECKCQFGSTTDKIVVLTQTKDYINDEGGSKKLIASTKDIGVPFQNKTFGSCTVSHSSCVPAVTEWMEFYENVTLTNQGKILTVKSKAKCSVGNAPCIMVVDHGQQAKIKEAHFDQVQPETLTFLNPAAPPAGRHRKEAPKIRNIKLTCPRESNPLHSKKNKQDQIVMLQAGIDESLQFDVEEFANASKCDKALTGWKIVKDHSFDGDAETFEKAGASFKVNFDALGKFRVIAFGSAGDEPEWHRCIDIEVVKNKIEGISIKDAALHGRADRSGNIMLRRGIPVVLQAKYKFSPVSEEDRQHVKALITDRSGAVLASEDADTIQFTPSNTAAEYNVSFTKAADVPEETIVVKKSIKTEANGVIAVKCLNAGETSDHLVRPGTAMTFNVTEIDYGTLVNADPTELSAIQWKLDNVLLPTRGPHLTLPGSMLMAQKKYTVNAFVAGERAGHKEDDWHFTVKRNELVSLEGPTEWLVGKRYTVTAKTLMGYRKELDGPVTWTPADIDTDPLTCAGVYATGIGNFKVTAVLGTSTKVLTAKASLAAVTRWCFTDTANAYKPKAGWNEKLNALITCKEAAGEKVNIHLLEYDSANDSNYIKDLGDATFDSNGDAKITFNTNDIKAALNKLNAEGDYYDLYFGILKKADGIQFADMKTKKIEGKEYYFPSKESNHTNKETGKFVYISSTKEIVSVKFLDSSGYPAYKVYNYGEKITVHIQTKNMAGEEVESTIIENIKDKRDKKIPGSKFKINDTEATNTEINTGVSQFKAGKTPLELNGIRLFYYQLESSKAKTILFPQQIGDDKMFNMGNANYYNHLKLSGIADTMNNILRPLAPVVLGEAYEGTSDNNCGGKFCIQVGSPKSELIREINIRLAGFGGNVPTDVFTPRSERMIRQFQRDYMKVSETGKVCGNVLKAIDEFCETYKFIFSEIKCKCTTKGKVTNDVLLGKATLNNCNGFGDGSNKGKYVKSGNSEKSHAYEHPGLHRSLLFALKAVKFYMDKINTKYKYDSISSGFRCRFHSVFMSTQTTNHMGKALDVLFNYEKGGRAQKQTDLDTIRKDYFEKYLGATYWTKNSNKEKCFGLETYAQGAKTWVHFDVREFDDEHLTDNFFCKIEEIFKGKSIVQIANESGYSNMCNCMGKIAEPVKKSEDAKCKQCKVLEATYRGKEREDFYNEFGSKAVDFMETKGGFNKFKALYFVAQRRQENGFSIDTPGNNPMNIKGNGDIGQIELDTHETLNGKYVAVRDKFANFSSENAGFDGYYKLLKANYPDAFSAVTNDSKSIDDFTNGLEDTGKLGPYATGKAKDNLTGTQQYKKAVKENFEGVLSDYKKWYKCKLTCPSYASQKKQIENDLKLLEELK